MLQYVGILIMISFSAALALLVVGLSHILGNRSAGKVKMQPYECGVETIGPTRRRLTIRYYIVAMLFLVFDLEILFLYPWAVITNKLGLFGFAEMIVFVAILFVGYVYVWKRGALEWE
jgi:NADH-quinone oxidoreductase subunit A